MNKLKTQLKPLLIWDILNREIKSYGISWRKISKKLSTTNSKARWFLHEL